MKIDSSLNKLRSQTQHFDDWSLAQAAAGGDRNAQREVAERLYEQIRMKLEFMMGRNRDLDDWIQQSIIHVLQHIGSYRGESTLDSWVQKVSVRHARRAAKQRKWRDMRVGLGRQNTADETRLFDAWMQTEKQADVRRCVAALFRIISPEQRSALILKNIYGHTIEEISEIIDVPANTVRQRLRRGKRKLREAVVKDSALNAWLG